MADLRVKEATLAKAQSTFRAAGDHLAPVAGILKGLNSAVVGAEPLSARLDTAHSTLAAELGIIGQALAELAAHASQINSAFDHVDQALTREARAVR